MATEAPVYRFTVEQYERMVESGVLTDDDRVELIEGEIVEMAPIGTRHAGCVKRLTHLLMTRFVDRAVVTVQNPARLPPRSEPQPDLTLAVPREDFYSRRHPEPSELFLVIEVADTTILFDRNVKMPLYARSKILEAWLVDLERDRLEVYREPRGGTYTSVEVLERHGSVSLLAFPDVAIPVDAVLP